MNTARISGKQDDLQKYFNGYVTSRLLKDPSLGREKWHWQYLENPFCPPENPAVWVCSIEGKMAGHLGTLPVEVKVGSKKVHAAWAVDFFTAPEFRGKGIGKSLTEESAKAFDLFLSVGNTDMSFGLFKKLGWKPLGDVPYYVKFWSWEAPLRKRIRNQAATAFLLAIFNGASGIYNALMHPKKSAEIRTERIETFDQEADELWAEVESFYTVVVIRSRAYLSWKYEKQPGMNYIKFRALRGRQLCGYIVVRAVKTGENPAEGLIADLIVRPNDTEAAHALLDAGLDYLRKEGCQLARCYATDKRIRKILAAAGFIKRQPVMRFMAYQKGGDLDAADQQDNWFIMAGDSDIDRS